MNDKTILLMENISDEKPVARDEALNRENIFVSTVFKSGTKLLERIIVELTGLLPENTANGNDWRSVNQITFPKEKFFIWHSIPTDELKNVLKENKAKAIFLVRNIYDLIVSQYYHFIHDVDKDIGRSVSVEKYLKFMGKEQALSLIISGAKSEHFSNNGFIQILIQIQEMLKFSKEYSKCHVIVYDRLVDDKPNEIILLAEFLGLDFTTRDLARCLRNTDIDFMRKERIQQGGSGLHFRKGLPRMHMHDLAPWHYHVIANLIALHAPELPSLCEELNLGDILSPTLSDEELYSVWNKRHV